jgi:hypothetical protein
MVADPRDGYAQPPRRQSSAISARMEFSVTQRNLFGHCDGTPIHAHVLGEADGLQAEVLEYGGILRRLSFPTRTGRK